MDNNLDSLNKIRQIYPEAFLIQGDCYFLPFQEQSIKQIISIYNLEHLYYLEEALKEIYRVLNDQGNFLAGLPCEGGIAWNTGRRFTSSWSLSKRYNLDYSKVIKIEHCNNIYKIINFLRKYFLIKKKKLFPFSFLSALYFNLTVSFWMTKK
ncbi:MAG: methyltransferase domain-containing protein [Armatimonadetes bacterium]|nr:methyltransferase domain-containing protein [Armatimonadota bacterium]